MLVLLMTALLIFDVTLANCLDDNLEAAKTDLGCCDKDTRKTIPSNIGNYTDLENM